MPTAKASAKFTASMKGQHAIEHTLRPFVVVMAGEGEFDPWKD